MTVESLLFIVVRISAMLTAWIATYAVHSTLLLTISWIGSALLVRTHASRELVWKAALIGGVFTATIQSLPAMQPTFGRYDVSSLVEKKLAQDLPLSRPATVNQSTQVFHARLPDVAETLRFAPIVMVILWAAYGLIILLRVFFATRRARAQLGPRTEVSDALLKGIFRSVLDRFRVRKPVRLTLSPEVASPVVLGATEVCIPKHMPQQFTPEEQASVLAHEVAHLVRRDPAWLLTAVTIESILFFQPLNKVARYRIQEEAEYLADELAVTRIGSGVTLARCLARVAEWMSGKHQSLMAPALMEQETSLVGRVKTLLERPQGAAARRISLRHLTMSVALPLFVLLVAPGFTSGGSRGWGKPAFRWEGKVDSGKFIEIKTLMGNVRAEPWNGSTVLVTATRHGRATNPDVSFAVVQHENGVTVCTLYPTPSGVPANSCTPGNGGREFNSKANDVEIDYLVNIPRGVGFSARTSTGDISTGLLSASVDATTLAGNIDVATTAYAQGVSASGNVTLRMGSTTWSNTLWVSTNSGNIRIYLPSAAVTRITASSRLGSVSDDFSLKGKRAGWFARLKPRGSFGDDASGILGDSAAVAAVHRALAIESIAGGITIKRNEGNR
ncbi:MAG: hypothetical protein H0U64_06420 [Gemmatimonadaceae bacterium]|nr:hypothetical protein [Gemmatimonadaceae bacterium]